MTFSNRKINPSSKVYTLLIPILFNSVRSTTKNKSNRRRQCFICMRDIEKGEHYIMHQFRYDSRIIPLSFHANCFDYPLKKNEKI